MRMLLSVVTSFFALSHGSAFTGHRLGVSPMARSQGSAAAAAQAGPADSLPAGELAHERLHALIVGVLEWPNGLQAYPKQNRKDQELRDLLVRRGTPAEHVTLLLDQDATLERIRAELVRSARAVGPGSTLLVYYAGHGMPAGQGDFCFANYELDLGDTLGTGWTLRELGETLACEFHGERVILCADCCFSGGLGIAVEELAQAGIAATCLTSASRANTSTNNWTFTQSLIDGLAGEPLVDLDGDGRVTLGELACEVRDAMQHLEGQRHGFEARGVPEGFVLARASRPRPKAAEAKFAVGSYVTAPDGERRRTGRIAARQGERYVVQYYDYSDKRTVSVEASELEASTRVAEVPPEEKDAGIEPDCEVEWQGRWWPAKVLRREGERTYIHYLGYEDSWDEWVGPKRIRSIGPKAGARSNDGANADPSRRRRLLGDPVLRD
jgi:hypothetical protein